MPLTTTLTVTEPLGQARARFPVIRGVPLPVGALREPVAARVIDAAGRGVPVQTRRLTRWPDGSVKWLLVDFQADVPGGGRAEYLLELGEGESVPPETPLLVTEDERRVTVCTGALQFTVSKTSFSLIESAALGSRIGNSPFTPEQVLIRSGLDGDAFVRIRECFIDADGSRRIYGLGGDCLASLAADEYRVTIEEAGPLRAVIRCDGKLEAAAPAGHYGGYRPFHSTTRIEAYAGTAHIRVLHTIVVACNPRETEIEEIGLRVPFARAMPGRPSCRIGLRRELTAPLLGGDSWLVSQSSDKYCRVDRRVGERSTMVAEQERGEGWIALEDGEAGLAVALPRMAEEQPKALGVTGAGAGIDVYLWRDPDGGRLNFRRYAEEVHWGQGEGIYADGTGTAKTSELFLYFYQAGGARPSPREAVLGLLTPPHAAVDPAWHDRCETAGLALRPRDRRAGGTQPKGGEEAEPNGFPQCERMLTGFIDWMARHVELGRWYGFFDYGDMRATWEREADDWRFHGRWGWCNSEWDPRHAFWVQYMRTGDPRYFDLGEAFTRHSVDVDTCHYHPFRPYMVGGCYRHSVDHFGDEPCASHTFPDNWVDYYSLTGDGRTLDVLKEAGEFFLRFRWTEDPRFSFSLRAVGNTLRGLLYAYELTEDERYRTRAEELFATIVQAQNADGSWNKRYQISTPDHLPDQLPYGMATEGTTWAVEMGTAPPFTEQEYRELWGSNWRGTRLLPDREQRGYQTHYLMISLELMHRMTGRADVAQVYVRGVDWFCGAPGERSLEAALPHAGAGILCRHLAYAYRLTQDRRYLEIGQGVLKHLIEQQDWRDDPRYHGAIEMNPTALSYHFFGVPALLAALRDAGMGEL